jgi:hypothetical protein
MATTTQKPLAAPMFDLQTSSRSLGRNLPQRVGRRLVLPMFGMAAMLFVAAFAVGAVRASEISQAGSLETTEILKQVGSGLMFLGFTAVLTAISFAIARILGEFRKGGGDVQEAAGRVVQTLKMPITAKLFLAGMMMGMMTLLAAVGLHFVFAADITSSASSLALSEERFTILEGVRRIGVAIYLVAIAFGLAAIVQLIRFQTIRIRQLPDEAPRAQ